MSPGTIFLITGWLMMQNVVDVGSLTFQRSLLPSVSLRSRLNNYNFPGNDNRRFRFRQQYLNHHREQDFQCVSHQLFQKTFIGLLVTMCPFTFNYPVGALEENIDNIQRY